MKKHITVAFIFSFFLHNSYAETTENHQKEEVNTAQVQLTRMLMMYQHDADLVRLEHLEYWTGLIEQYHQIKGFYPLQDTLQKDKPIGLVKIITKQQKKNLLVTGFNNNKDGRFAELDIANLVRELEKVLGKEIDEKYDVQKYPTTSPIGYNYFYTNDGYLMWVTCITCGVNKISTLLLDGHTPTVNIASSGMKDKVYKSMLRTEMLKHPTYKQLTARPFNKEAYVRKVEKDNSHDSKK